MGQTPRFSKSNISTGHYLFPLPKPPTGPLPYTARGTKPVLNNSGSF